MKYASKWIAMLLAVLMLLSSVTALAEGAQDTQPAGTDEVQDVKSVSGAFAAKSDTQLFLVLPNETGSSLYAMPLAGGALTLVDSASQIDGAFCVEGSLYYLSYTGVSFNVNCRAADGSRTILAAFNAPQVVSSLSWYDGSLYALVDGKLTRVEMNGAITTVSNQLMDEYCIADGIIYYASSENQKTYTKESALTPGSTISQSAGCLYQMLLDGTGNVVFYEQGVSALKAFGDNLYFHNMDKNYNVSGVDQEWLDGLLFRVNVLTAQMVLVSSTYDWDYRPTDSGMVIYRKEQIVLTGMDGVETTLYTPDPYSYVALLNDCAIVYEYNLQKLTMVPYNGTGTVLLHEGAFIANNSEVGNAVNSVTTDATQTPAAGDATTGAQTPATGNATATPTGSIMYGESSDRVKAMQKRLVELGYLASADGVFGDKTLAAVRAFQKKAGLSVDGIAGERTLSTLNSSTAPKADKIAEVGDSSYIFPNSSKKKLTREEILKVDKSLWPYARNEIYARHGYSFSNATYKKYFSAKSWYKEGGFSTKDLSETEWYNMDLLKEMEKEYASSSGSGSSSTDSSYIFPNSSTQKLTKAEIRKVDKSLWPYARNEIYARHGYSFTNADYKKYFSGKSWYKAGGFSTKDLNEIEWYNMDLIKWMEDNEG